MRHGFVKVAAATPDIQVADCEYNANRIIELIETSAEKEVKIVVFPELCLSGYTCGELFFQDALLKGCLYYLEKIIQATKMKDMLVLVGLPFMKEGKLYNVAAVIKDGKLLGLVPKTNLPNYSEFYEARYFHAGNQKAEWIYWNGEKVPFGTDILFICENIPDLVVAAEICEDLWVAVPPSIRHTMAGGTIICNLSASDETTGKESYRRELVKGQSARLVCGYIYADAGEGESTTDLVYCGHNIIAENGSILGETARFRNELLITELDVQKIINERRRITTYDISGLEGYTEVGFTYTQKGWQGVKLPMTVLTRTFERLPFVPANKADRDQRCYEITNIQALGLKKRLAHTGMKYAVVGISGGLDSTLALLVTCKTFDMLKIPKENILAVTMPCFGTTDRTYQNAIALAEELHVTCKEISIREAVKQHLEDLEHDMETHDATYENAQARERTQVLMDMANQYSGLVVGTGDMSELALGWATYNGDHMSMYAVNCSIPKTLVRYLVLYFAETAKNTGLSDVLFDILDTPVSPELLPPKDGKISQETESIVGPYELHDFFLYYSMRYGFMPQKIYRMACYSFVGEYDEMVIYNWMKVFYSRFFSQQFKRSCIPDGPRVGSVALSPRGDLRMPSDACANIWLKDLESIAVKKE